MIALALALAAQAGAVAVTDKEVSEQQLVMLDRVGRAANAYRIRLGLPERYRWYCQTKLNVATKDLKGVPPFPEAYTDIKTQDELDLVLNAREAFERSYLELCLADAKRSFGSDPP